MRLPPRPPPGRLLAEPTLPAGLVLAVFALWLGWADLRWHLDEAAISRRGIDAEALVIDRRRFEQVNRHRRVLQHELRLRLDGPDGQPVEVTRLLDAEVWQGVVVGSVARVRLLPEAPERLRLIDPPEMPVSSSLAVVTIVLGLLALGLLGHAWQRAGRRDAGRRRA